MKPTFGSYVASQRKKLGMSQKELAQKILREEDNQPISPQYLNDIERDRRQPTSDHLLRQFATALNVREEEVDYLFFLSGTLPADILDRDPSPKQVAAAFKAFRKS